jgi:hypothetical protein
MIWVSLNSVLIIERETFSAKSVVFLLPEKLTMTELIKGCEDRGNRNLWQEESFADNSMCLKHLT